MYNKIRTSYKKLCKKLNSLVKADNTSSNYYSISRKILIIAIISNRNLLENNRKK